MKNVVKLVGIIVLIAVVGFSMVSCNKAKDALDGTTWEAVLDGKYILKFNSPNVTLTVVGVGEEEGSYAISDKLDVTLSFVKSGKFNATLAGKTLSWHNFDDGQPLMFTKK